MTARKETSPRLSTLAALMRARIRRTGDLSAVTVEEVESVIGSVLGQDETKGQGERAGLTGSEAADLAALRRGD